MMSTLSPAVPTPIIQGEKRTIYNLCVPSLRQHRTHPFTTWSRRRREMAEHHKLSPRRIGGRRLLTGEDWMIDVLVIA